MLHVDAITLKNYRCFPISSPARIDLGQGFTALIGANNSGKSSFLRFFYEYRALFRALADPGQFVQALRGRPESFNVAVTYDQTEPFCNLNDQGIEIRLDLTSDEGPYGANRLPLPSRVIVEIPRGHNTCVVYIDCPGHEHLGGDQIDNAQNMKVAVNRAHVAELTGVSEAIAELASTLYIGPFRNIINVGTNEQYFDIRTGQAFIQQWRALKTGGEKEHNEIIHRLTKDISRIFDLDDLTIDASDDGQTLQLMVNGKSYKLPELGSGIAQFIMVLGNAAIANPAYILIDEPEMNLHPSLQLDFLTTLASYATKGILFSTHSIGLARFADRIYSVREGGEGGSRVTEYEKTPHLADFLSELSFSGYQELGFDKVLLVEGRTDVKTIQQFLRQYKIDHQIVLLPLGGADMISGKSEAELQEVQRITTNIAVLIDSERSAPDRALARPRRAFVETCENLKIPCHVLKYRATENYLSDRAVKKIKGEKYKALEPYQKLNDISPAWAKNENWRIAREMTKAEINSTDLGEFLSNL